MSIKIDVLTPWLKHKPRKATDPVQLIVIHATAGSTSSGAIDTLRTKGFGYHYLIEDQRETDGRIIKCAPLSSVTSHAGNSYGPIEQKKGISRVQNPKTRNFVAKTSVNPYSIGISLVNRNTGADPYSEKQFQSCLELVRILKEAFPTITHITTHYEVSPKRKSDPLGFDIERLARESGLDLWRFPK